MQKRNYNNKYYARYSGLAFEMLGIIVFGVWLGQKLDAHRNSETPVFTIVCSLAAIFAALYLVINDVKNNRFKP